MGHDGRVTIASPSTGDDFLITGEAVAVEVRPASFALRAVGAFIDAAVTLLLLALTFLSLDLLDVAFGFDSASGTAITIVTAVFFLVVLPTIVETATNGRSLGKLAIGGRIVRDDGGAIQLRHAFIRALIGVLEVYMTLGSVAVIVGLMSARAKRLGDLVAGTYSRHERVPRAQARVFAIPPQLESWSRTADVARMPDALSRRIARFLSQPGAATDPSRARLAAALAAEVSAYVSPLPEAAPGELLSAVAALRSQRESIALARQGAVLERVAPQLSLPRGFPDRG